MAHEYDPRDLIGEAYRIEGVTPEECRTIFLDWALGKADSPDEATQIAALLDAFGAEKPDHPMTAVLREGLSGAAAPRGRRGGRKGRMQA